MRIPHTHDYTYHYIAEAGLGKDDLRPFVNSVGTGFYAIDRTSARESEYTSFIFPLFADKLTSRERVAAKENPGGLLGLYMGPLFVELTPKWRRALLAGDFNDPFLAELDRVSWKQFLVNSGASEGAMELIGRVLGIQAVWDWSFAAILRDELHHLNPRFEEIVDGLDRLPNQLQTKLPETVNIRFNQEVIDISPARNLCIVRDRSSGEEEKLEFQHLLVTLPFPVLAEMPLTEMSASKVAAIRSMPYASACKDLLAFEERFWEDQGIRGGRSKSDGPKQKVLYFRETYYPMDRLPQMADSAHRQAVASLAGSCDLYVGQTEVPAQAIDKGAAPGPTPGTLLAAYTLNAGAQKLQALSPGERRQAVIKSLESIHGQAVRRFAHHLPWSWDDYPWSRGGFGITPPNYLVDTWANAKRPEEQVFFAGEHLSIAPGWIQGAFESALREVEAMLKSVH